MTTTPAPEPTPAPVSPVTIPAPPAATANFLSRAFHALEAHVVPALKTVDASAEKLITEALRLEAVVQTADPALASQLAASAAVLRDIAAALAAL